MELSVITSESVQWDDLFAKVNQDDLGTQLQATSEIRRILSKPDPPIGEVINKGFVPRLVVFLKSEHTELKLEAVWCLSTIAHGTPEHTEVLVSCGAIPMLVELLRSTNENAIREEAAWALGNIAGDSLERRLIILGHGVLSPLIALLKENPGIATMRGAAFALSNLCRDNPHFEEDPLPILHTLMHSDDKEVVVDACWALTYLSDDNNGEIQAVFPTRIRIRLMALVNQESPLLAMPTLRAIGNIINRDDVNTQDMIDLGVLPHLKEFLNESQNENLKKQACWIISSITAGNDVHIQSVIDAEIVDPLIQLLQNAEINVKNHAAWAISNAISGGTPEQIKYLVSRKCINALGGWLELGNPRVLIVCFKALEKVLQLGASYGQDVFDELNVQMEKLMQKGSAEVKEKAGKTFASIDTCSIPY